ncbi:flippase [Enterococcus avium]|uniref:flippase n=1 Tax=Enterococcus avium TaxID=33945 RepID=UPI00288DF43B|nr:flippase [Enterococcus avium]MDT2565991.1 flippase [Enterococcus avium]
MKSLLKNSLYNIIYRAFSLLFPLVSSIYVSRILLPKGVGEVSLAQNLVSYFITFAGLGMVNYAVKEVGAIQNSKEKYSEVFLELFIINLISTLFCSFIYFFIVFETDFFSGNQILYIAVGLQLILNFANVDWFFQGLEEYGYITLRSFVVKFLSLLAIIIFVKDKNDIVLFALINSLALAGNNLFNLFHLRKYLQINVRNFSFYNLKKHLKPLFLMLSTSLSIELYTKLDTTMLGIMTPIENVGYYSYATKISNILVTLAASVTVALLPRLSYYFKSAMSKEFSTMINLANKVLWFVTVPSVVGVFLLSDKIIILLFGSNFGPAGLTLKILSCLMFIKAIGNLFGTQVLLTVGKERYLFYTTLLGAISNIALNLVLIPIFQQNGAATASVISELLVLLAQVHFALRFVNIEMNIKFISKIFVATLIMVLFILFILFSIDQIIIQIVLSIFGGGGIYLIANYYLKNEVYSFLKFKKS